jgi:hypothetical protein
MATTQLAIHVPQEATPENVSAMLAAIRDHQSTFKTVDDLLRFTVEEGIGGRTEMQSIAQHMGLLHKSVEGITISSNGNLVIGLKEALRPEIFHFLFYTGWNRSEPRSFLPAWAYRQTTDRYWTEGTLELNSESANLAVADIIAQAETSFAELGVEDIEGISFSPKSLRGVRKWLEALTPPVIEKDTFSRRTFCSPELLLLAIGWAFHAEADPVGVPLLLSRDRREVICRLCLLDPNHFDRVLDWMLPRFPKVIESGDKAGFYGRSIRLRKMPTLEDIVS